MPAVTLSGKVRITDILNGPLGFCKLIYDKLIYTYPLLFCSRDSLNSELIRFLYFKNDYSDYSHFNFGKKVGFSTLRRLTPAS